LTQGPPGVTRVMPPAAHPFERAWGHAVAFLDRSRRLNLADLLVLLGLAGLFIGVARVGHEWTGTLRPVVSIDLSPAALPRYAFYSLSRGLLAYVLSLGFTLVYGYWAAKDRLAERVLLPLLDVLQSVPILGFMPGLVLALVALFPRTNIGLELAAVIMMFTGQVWNMTFSFHHSLRSVPEEFQEVGSAYRFSAWERLKWVELPFATTGLVWNSMMSMAGGWFFLMINEAFVLGDRDFRLPGLGSYMSVAVAHGDGRAMVWAVLAMIGMIVLLDQFLWRPAVVWAQRFRYEETASTESESSWFLDWLRRSRLLRSLGRLLPRLRPGARRIATPRPVLAPLPVAPAPAGGSRVGRVVSILALAVLIGLLLFAGVRLVALLGAVPLPRWLGLVGATLVTLLRVLVAVVVGTLWTLPAGLAIGLSPRLSRALQPVTQVAASFPAPMLFPAVLALLHLLGVPLSVGSIVLMLLGTQWYILFNVVAGASAIPTDLREAATSYRLSRWRRFTSLYAPAVFPYLVTGWVTAAGGAWNASIVAEYVSFHGRVHTAWGVGSQISLAAQNADFPALAASVLVLSAMVVTFNRLVWRRCYHLAERRYSLNR
jgi:NitT/TauT family transport system permease protein